MYDLEKTSFYVSTEGNDLWSGTLPTANADKTDGPFLTIEKARDAVRAKPQQRADIITEIRGGTYFLNETVEFTEEDSSKDTYKKIIYKAYKNEKPVFTSAVAVENWTLSEDENIPEIAKGKVWEADIPKNVGLCTSLFNKTCLMKRSSSKLFFPALSDDLNSAKEENLEFTGRINKDALPKGKEKLFVFKFPEGILNKIENVTDLEAYSRSRNWTMNLLPIQQIDFENRVALTSVAGTYPFEPRHINPSVAFENHISFFKNEGEWAVDTFKNKIYIFQTQKPCDIKAPTLKELFYIHGIGDIDGNNNTGNNEVPARGIVFEGLSFTGTKRDTWTRQDVGIQHDWEMLDKATALIRFNNVWRCGLENCELTLSGGTGVRFDNYAKNCYVHGCHISNLGQSGILFFGYGPGTKDVNKNNAVTNCDIHDLGQIYHHSHGISLFQSGDNRISHNYIHDMPRKAICLTGVRREYYDECCRDMREFSLSIRWKEVKLPIKVWEDAEIYAHTKNNLVEYNNVENLLQKLSDGAGINVSGAGRGNIIRRNYLHHIYSAPGEFLSGALRTDDDQFGTEIYENVIAHTNCPSFEFKCENKFFNNVIFDVDPSKMISFWTRWGLPDRGEITKNIFIDVYSNSDFYGRVEQLYESGTMTIDDNIYYRYSEDKVYKDDLHMQISKNRFFEPYPRNQELEMLKDIGHDTNSLYGVDPMLVDVENNDFRLSENSVAHKLGIVSINISKTGPQGKYKK